MVFSTSSFTPGGSCPNAMIAGMGLGIISDLAVREEIEVGSITEVIVHGHPALVRDFFAVVLVGRDLSPPARRFLEFLQTQRS